MNSNKKVSIAIPLQLTESTSFNEQELKKIKKTLSNTQQESFQASKNVEKNLSIPVIDLGKPKKDEILKTGLLICTRIEKWYTKSASLGEIELKKTRLRWRQFKAILYPDRLELYHFSNRLTSSKRLAYTIYFKKSYPYRPVKLALVSPQDFIWSLTYLHYERKSWISFHFLSNKISEAQAWYMLIYQQLPDIVYYKKLIPSFVDIQFTHSTSPVLIRLPLHLLQYSQVDIPVDQLMAVLKQLISNEVSIPLDQLDNLELGWKPTHIHIPWMETVNRLVIPQLIEQTHQLTLYTKETPSKKKIRNYDGLLIQKTWCGSKKLRDRPFYALVFGHHLYFFDGPYYRRYKREKETKKPNWFHVTTGLLFQQRKIVINKNNKSKTMFQSEPLLNRQSATVTLPEASVLLNSRYMIDLQHQVVRAQVSAKGNRLFELELYNKKVLYYEAPSTQIMLQWITMINNSISLDHFLLFDSPSYNTQAILLSSDMYMKENYHGTFKKYTCVLSSDASNTGIMLFKMNDKLQVYERYRFISIGESDYIYSGDECILDKLISLNNIDQREPSHYYANDQLVTTQDKISDCVFVIWQMKKRHILTSFREYLSFFKLGHRLGNRGKYWIFKARNKQERDEWIWALHFEISNK